MAYTSRLYKTRGIILKRKNFGEADKILTVYSKTHGKVRVLAKGVRKVSSKRAPHIEVFKYVHLTVYKGKHFDILTEALSIQKEPKDITRIQDISLAYYVCEIVDQLTAYEQSNEELFHKLFTTLKFMLSGASYRAKEAHLYAFALETLKDLGFLPESHTLDKTEVVRFVEGIINKRIKSQQLLTRLSDA